MDDTTKTIEAATKTTQDTVKEVSQFTTYLQNHIPLCFSLLEEL